MHNKLYTTEYDVEKMIYFTSDTHFGDEETLIRENRPFKTAKEFDRKVIKIFNSQANENDTIYHLGDFINCNSKDKTSWEKSIKYVKRIKAKIVLIIGNNEERVIKLFFNDDFEKFREYCKKLGFLDVKKEEYITINGTNFYLNHYPHNHKDNFFNLFGHTHRTTGLWKPYGLNVGCDLNHFYLFSINEIERLIDLKKKWWDNDVDNLSM